MTQKIMPFVVATFLFITAMTWILSLRSCTIEQTKMQKACLENTKAPECAKIGVMQ